MGQDTGRIAAVTQRSLLALVTAVAEAAERVERRGTGKAVASLALIEKTF